MMMIRWLLYLVMVLGTATVLWWTRAHPYCDRARADGYQVCLRIPETCPTSLTEFDRQRAAYYQCEDHK